MAAGSEEIKEVRMWIKTPIAALGIAGALGAATPGTHAALKVFISVRTE